VKLASVLLTECLGKWLYETMLWLEGRLPLVIYRLCKLFHLDRISRMLDTMRSVFCSSKNRGPLRFPPKIDTKIRMNSHETPAFDSHVL